MLRCYDSKQIASQYHGRNFCTIYSNGQEKPRNAKIINQQQQKKKKTEVLELTLTSCVPWSTVRTVSIRQSWRLQTSAERSQRAGERRGIHEEQEKHQVNMKTEV